MNWLFETAGIVQQGNRSHYGQYRAVERLGAAKAKLSFEKTESYTDLWELATAWQFAWGPKGVVTKRAQDGTLRLKDTGLKRDPNGNSLELTLRDCLEDIARVLSPERGDVLIRQPTLAKSTMAWKLGAGGGLHFYWLRPTKLAEDIRRHPVLPADYTRLVIFLYPGVIDGGEYGRFYKWSVRYADVNEFMVTEPLRKFDARAIDQVCDKVFVIKSANNTRGVLKFEAFNLTTPKYESIWNLYRYVLESTPATRPMTHEDIDYVAETKPTPGTTYVNENGYKSPGDPLSEFLDFARIDGVVLRKLEFCDIGGSLLSRIAKCNNKGDYELLFSFVFVERQFLVLGKMAALDAVSGNSDRITPFAVNTKNLDFNSGGQLIALDNINPNSEIFGRQPDGSVDASSWPAWQYMENETGWGSYAEKTFTSLIKETGVATYVASQHVENAKIKCVNAFVEGLKAGVVTMKLVLPRYKKNSREGNWGDTAKIIAARIDAIPYPV